MVEIGLYVSSGSGSVISGVRVVSGSVVVSITIPFPIVISAQPRNSSCGPHPTCSVPFGQVPQLFPAKAFH